MFCKRTLIKLASLTFFLGISALGMSQTLDLSSNQRLLDFFGEKKVFYPSFNFSSISQVSIEVCLDQTDGHAKLVVQAGRSTQVAQWRESDLRRGNPVVVYLQTFDGLAPFVIGQEPSGRIYFYSQPIQTQTSQSLVRMGAPLQYGWVWYYPDGSFCPDATTKEKATKKYYLNSSASVSTMMQRGHDAIIRKQAEFEETQYQAREEQRRREEEEQRRIEEERRRKEEEERLAKERWIKEHSHRLTINVADPDRNTAILINGEKKGVAEWDGVLEPGDYTITCRKPLCDPIVKKVHILNFDINLDIEEPLPEERPLDIVVAPNSANVVLDGQKLTRVPGSVIKTKVRMKLPHTLVIYSDGYDIVSCRVVIDEHSNISMSVEKNERSTISSEKGKIFCSLHESFSHKYHQTWIGEVQDDFKSNFFSIPLYLENTNSPCVYFPLSWTHIKTHLGFYTTIGVGIALDDSGVDDGNDDNDVGYGPLNEPVKSNGSANDVPFSEVVDSLRSVTYGMFMVGPVLRLTSGNRCDFQLYGGLGMAARSFAGEVGIRISRPKNHDHIFQSFMLGTMFTPNMQFICYCYGVTFNINR